MTSKTQNNTEIDGWVFEWVCPGCESDLTIGITNDGRERIIQMVRACPYCGIHPTDGLVQRRTIYSGGMSGVMKHVAAGNKIAAIRELRQMNTRTGLGPSDIKGCKKEIEHLIDEYKERQKINEDIPF